MARRSYIQWNVDGDDNVRIAFYYSNMLNRIFIVLDHWNSCLQVYMSVRSETFSWCRDNTSRLLLLPWIACLAKKQYIPISWLGLTRPGLERMIYRTRVEHTNRHTNDAATGAWTYDLANSK